MLTDRTAKSVKEFIRCQIKSRVAISRSNKEIVARLLLRRAHQTRSTVDLSGKASKACICECILLAKL